MAQITPGAAIAAPAITEYPVGAGPTAIASGPDGDLWFGEYNNGTGGVIGRVNTGGSYLPIDYTAGTGPYGAVNDGQGNVWVGLRSEYEVLCLTPLPNDPRHASARAVDISPGSGPAGLAHGPGGKIWWTEPASGNIGRMDPACQAGPALLETRVRATNASLVQATPAEIVAGPDGNMWFTDYTNNAIGRLPPTASSSTDVTEFPLPNGGTQPAGIAAGPDGRLWFTEDAGNRIGSITTSGAFGPDIPLPTPASHPGGITAGSDGNLWFVESGAHQVGWVSPGSGTLGGEIPFTSAIYPAAGWSSSVIEDHIVTGSDGNPWFTESAYNLVGEVNLHPEPAPPAPPASPPVLLGTGPSTPPANPGGGPSGPAATVAVAGLRIRPAVFASASRGPTAAAARQAAKPKPAKTGAKVSFTLSAAATMRFTVSRTSRGRRSARGGRCVQVRRGNRRGRACVIIRAIGSFTWSAKAGANALHFTGRLGGRRLSVGRYQLVATPSAGGQLGRSQAAGFRIRR